MIFPDEPIDCIGPGLPDMTCPQCGHEWALHQNTNACCAVVGKDDDSEHFAGATRYCLCDALPPPTKTEGAA